MAGQARTLQADHIQAARSVAHLGRDAGWTLWRLPRVGYGVRTIGTGTSGYDVLCPNARNVVVHHNGSTRWTYIAPLAYRAGRPANWCASSDGPTTCWRCGNHNREILHRQT